MKPPKGADFYYGFDLPFKTRRASQERAPDFSLGRSAVQAERVALSAPFPRSTGQPEGPRLMGV